MERNTLTPHLKQNSRDQSSVVLPLKLEETPIIMGVISMISTIGVHDPVKYAHDDSP